MNLVLREERRTNPSSRSSIYPLYLLFSHAPPMPPMTRSMPSANPMQKRKPVENFYPRMRKSKGDNRSNMKGITRRPSAPGSSLFPAMDFFPSRFPPTAAVSLFLLFHPSKETPFLSPTSPKRSPPSSRTVQACPKYEEDRSRNEEKRDQKSEGIIIRLRSIC